MTDRKQLREMAGGLLGCCAGVQVGIYAARAYAYYKFGAGFEPVLEFITVPAIFVSVLLIGYAGADLAGRFPLLFSLTILPAGIWSVVAATLWHMHRLTSFLYLSAAPKVPGTLPGSQSIVTSQPWRE